MLSYLLKTTNFFDSFYILLPKLFASGHLVEILCSPLFQRKGLLLLFTEERAEARGRQLTESASKWWHLTYSNHPDSYILTGDFHP